MDSGVLPGLDRDVKPPEPALNALPSHAEKITKSGKGWKPGIELITRKALIKAAAQPKLNLIQGGNLNDQPLTPAHRMKGCSSAASKPNKSILYHHSLCFCYKQYLQYKLKDSETWEIQSLIKK